jgi:hypothetical protein
MGLSISGYILTHSTPDTHPLKKGKYDQIINMLTLRYLEDEALYSVPTPY